MQVFDLSGEGKVLVDNGKVGAELGETPDGLYVGRWLIHLFGVIAYQTICNLVLGLPNSPLVC